ncbi:MAG: hypothetical protein HYS18_01700 [Burkholderiales bacterium]|nr:hypothetical protein [Burkholderiales bacterium]
MLKKMLISAAAFSPTLALATHPHFHFHGHGRWFAPEIDGGVAILGIAILGGVLAFMKKKA